MIKIQAKYALAIQHFVSNEKSRTNINGFYVEPCVHGGVMIVATDGHKLAVFHDEAGHCDKAEIVELNTDTVKACKTPKKETINRYLIVSNQGLATIYTGNDAPVAMQHGVFNNETFPDWRRVVPSETEPKNAKQFIAFNFQYFDAFVKMAKDIGATNAYMCISSQNANTTALITSDNIPEFIGILSPVTCSDAGKLPAWFAT